MTSSPLLKELAQRNLGKKMSEESFKPEEQEQLKRTLTIKKMIEKFIFPMARTYQSNPNYKVNNYLENEITPGKRISLTIKEEIERHLEYCKHGIAEQKQESVEVMFLYANFFTEKLQALEEPDDSGNSLITPGRFMVFKPCIIQHIFYVHSTKSKDSTVLKLSKIAKSYLVIKQATKTEEKNLEQKLQTIKKEGKTEQFDLEKLALELCHIIQATGLVESYISDIKSVSENTLAFTNFSPYSIYKLNKQGKWQINEAVLEHNAVIGLNRLYYNCLSLCDKMAAVVKNFIDEHAIKTEDCPVCQDDILVLDAPTK